MIKTVEAVIDERGRVQLLEPVQLSAARRALVTILDAGPATSVSETALLSEPALAEDWNRPEEDEAWLHQQPTDYVRVSERLYQGQTIDEIFERAKENWKE